MHVPDTPDISHGTTDRSGLHQTTTWSYMGHDSNVVSRVILIGISPIEGPVHHLPAHYKGTKGPGSSTLEDYPSYPCTPKYPSSKVTYLGLCRICAKSSQTIYNLAPFGSAHGISTRPLSSRPTQSTSKRRTFWVHDTTPVGSMTRHPLGP